MFLKKGKNKGGIKGERVMVEKWGKKRGEIEKV